MKYISILISLICLFLANIPWAQSELTTDKTLSPYFFIKGDDVVVDQLPLKSTSAEVNIAGVIADVKVTQLYQNQGKQAIEAIYVFPASTRAAVHGMKMTIGERTIIAKIQEKEKARQEYEQAKQEGKSASLLEQQRPNVFQMNVANIMPGDNIQVELRYTELLIPSEGIYEFVYPSVVGPRYSNQSEDNASSTEKWIKNPYLHEGKKPPYEFAITTKITASLPIQEIFCSSHKVNVSYESTGIANVQLDSTEKSGGNRDYILKYRLRGGQIESGLLLYQSEKESFFLLMMQPPQKVTAAQIPAREYIFIVDISGSMHGFPLDISKKLLKDLIGGLKTEDTFNVLLFAGSSSILAEHSLPATSKNIAKAIQVIDEQRGGGGTELLPALQRALRLSSDEKRSRTVVVVTDGYVSVEKETFQVIRENLGKANIFSFGIGSSVNRYLMEGIARAGLGEPFIITTENEAPSIAENFKQYIQSPILTKIKVDLGDFMAYDVEPVSIPDMFAARPVIVFGKWKGIPQGTIKLEGLSGDKSYLTNLDVSQVKPSPTNSALRYLWARNRIAMLADYHHFSHDDTHTQEITRLGLDYNLLTDFTSFVAIDSLRRNPTGKSSTVYQPLPLPEGVSNFAVSTRSLHTLMAKAVAPSVSPDFEKRRYLSSPENSVSVQEETKDTTAQSANKEKSDQEISINHLAEQMIISDNLSKVAANKFIDEHLKEFERCSLGIKPIILEKFSMKLTIDGSGKVFKVEVDIENHLLKTCIIGLVNGWIFPASRDGKEATVEYIFTLTR